LEKKIDKKAKELRKRRKEVYSQINRHNIAYGRIAQFIFTIVGLVVIYLNWGFLISHLANLLSKGAVIQDPSQAPTVANYLLLILIIATVGVESIPFLGIGGIGQDSALIVSPTP